jgi:hypothetical protein
MDTLSKQVTSDERSRLRAYKRKVLFAGFTILAVSFLIGIVLSFIEWDRGSPFEMANWNYFNPVGRASWGPLAFAIVLFPITLPIVGVLSVLIHLSLKKQKLWPVSLLGFVVLGALWLLWVTGLWQID